MGAVDELNSVIGLLMTESLPGSIRETLSAVSTRAIRPGRGNLDTQPAVNTQRTGLPRSNTCLII